MGFDSHHPQRGRTMRILKTLLLPLLLILSLIGVDRLQPPRPAQPSNLPLVPVR
jgi:hypothetical protein